MVSASKQQYIGKELAIFANANNWSGYVSDQIAPFLSGAVLEVGAGIGNRTRRLCKHASKWLALEPDTGLCQSLIATKSADPGMHNVTVLQGTIADLHGDCRFDAILYIDVLEHISDDREQLMLACEKLNSKGRLIVLSPAHNWLYSDFDLSIGHFRRYTLSTLQAIVPKDMKVLRGRMLDSFGILLSLANLIWLRQSVPTARQIKFWDGFVVRISRVIDPLFGFRLGKSVLVVWGKS